MCPHCDPNKLKPINSTDFRLETFADEWFLTNCDDTTRIYFCPVCGRDLEKNDNG